ncbi:MAG TPA: hydroxyacid dehydrogenase [Thermodesulfobacteriota bacterium]|nr:hydroxyacid dehydrogenase [Thermodesulfobacteriota bacterium]
MKIYLGEVIHPKAVELLEKSAEVVRPKDHSRKAFLEALSAADGMVARKVYIGREELEGAPKMKIVARHGVGLDSVDLPEATRRGVLVTYTPGENRESVAELAVDFMLALARRIPQAQKAMADMPKGDIAVFTALLKQYNLTGMDLQGKRLGVIGTGRIGSRVAKICAAAFDMKVKGYDPYVAAEAMKSFGVEKVDRLADLLRDIDFLTVHAPLTGETKGMVADRALAMMKKGSFVVNTARGGIVSETALLSALQSGHIAGAALDVWEVEPPDPKSPLLNHPNLLGTPHYAGTTEESLYRVGMAAVEEVLRFFRGEPPKNPANPEVLKRK